ncbi:phage gp6-like head-tail connector protein [Enterococcus gilvus]|uniref:Phage gp6-like head-tail connector protein n=1 Tax=Enterococcus gilvus ATCC BAA-350 TaxID=1158614 RepID=R2XTS4_9ENTE|nr:phage gp6-like head-tail connector protein [Enterococcus gilvus]EOI53387.1 hypothetical protein UKC_03339 [Enterococcus gilvus ATCC BAA-350]EOW81338.1 hypothetical protein I592_00623 [Enterococcus gilvus ATCC BAA-350]OJG40380.1 hypothetical protein RV02_GL002422 [Enterococcus gilvus]
MEKLLEEFKKRMHISHSSEDNSLEEILEESKLYIISKTGLDENDKRAKTLIFSRARYVYNDSLEFFEDNFLSEILGLSFEKYKGDDASETEVSTTKN